MISVSLATPADDAELRELMALTTLPGEITLAMQREPSLFAAGPAMGDVHQVLVSREAGRVVGMAERAERSLYLDGLPALVGYLSGVRVHPEHRGGSSLFRGFRFLRRLHEGGGARLYLTTIARDNAEARAVLTSGRAGLPAYHAAGGYVTAAVPVRRAIRPAPLPGGTVTEATAADLDELAGFLASEGSRHPFFPVVQRADLVALPDGRLAGMQLSDLVVAGKHGAIAGCLARWDQHTYKQWRLVSYGWRMTLARPLYALLAVAFGWPALPPPGDEVPSVYAALALSSGDDPEIFRALATALVARERVRGGAFVSFGLLESDPRLAVIRELSPFMLYADLYVVTFDAEGEVARTLLRKKQWYVELATL